MIEREHVVKQLDAWLNSRSESVNHRQLIVISGEPQWSIELAKTIVEADRRIHKQNDYCWLGNHCPASFYNSPTKPTALLGTENRAAVINTHDAFDANALLIATGTVAECGLLIILAAGCEKWPTALSTLAKPSFGITQSYSYFAQRFNTMLKQSTSVMWITPHEIIWPAEMMIARNKDEFHHQHFANRQQQDVAMQVFEWLNTSTPQLITLTAKRGRGKSWLLGYCIQQLLTQGKRIAIVSSQARSAHAVFAQIDPHPNASNCEYHAPDSECLQENGYDLIVIDEAASIPLPILDKICAGQVSTLLSTTIDGYEGTAHGFLLRLLPQLASRYSQHHSVELTRPIRWLENDPIEDLWNDVFCLSPLSRETNVPQQLDAIVEVTAEQLLADEALLRKTFQLLREAHYQTTPHDLIRMLDSPDTRVVVAMADETVMGAMIVIQEGNDSLAALANEIASGSRRPNGHMSAQLLSFHCAAPVFATRRYLRVNRIAVRRDQRNSGIGSALLAWLKQKAVEENIDFVTTVFGDDGSLNTFWAKNAFKAFYRGKKKQKSSNHNNALYVSSVNEAAQQLLAQYSSPSLERHITILRHYAQGHRSLDSVSASLAAVLRAHESAAEFSIIALIGSTPEENEAYWCEHLKLHGKRHLRTAAREAVEAFLKTLE